MDSFNLTPVLRWGRLQEDIAEILILAGHLKGYNTRDEDIAEEWREW